MSLHRQSLYPSASSASQSMSQQTALQARIAAKRAELQSLVQLRDLSANLASQMSQLEAKLATLRDGTEAVAHVMANWDGVLGVIGMVGKTMGGLGKTAGHDEDENNNEKAELPETLVRIPVTQDQKVAKEEPENQSNIAT